MFNTVIMFFNAMLVTSGIFLITRYVLLEQGMEEKKQRLFYIVSFSLILVSFLLASIGLIMDVSSGIAVFCGGLNIALARKKHRFLGFLLVFPMIGLVDGFFAPVILMQLLPVSETVQFVLTMGMFSCFLAFFIVFYFKGKKWRKWFSENMGNRRPMASEYAVLCIAGCVLMAASMIVNSFTMLELGADAEAAVHWMMALYEVCAFLLTATIVVLILQGNSRKFYHDGVSNMQFNVIATMADIVENRDANTGGHIKRTAKYVEIIGKNLKKENKFSQILTDRYLADMIVAAPLHDIGKISIPDAILNKAGKLTDEEYEIMKTHTTAGRDVLKKAEKQLGEFNYLEVALDMAEYHHEWWNGKGYPTGKAGKDIPLCARIMAVADVFDALTSKRCYKAAMPLEKAYGIIKEEMGTHFDPVIAAVFLASSEEVEAAFSELSDD